MYIKRLKLSNIKGFKEIDFDFTRKDGSKDGSFAGWTVLVGGNSSGKSTILKGIALAVMGAESGRTYIQHDLSSWIKFGEKQAEITITICKDSEDSIQQKGTPPAQVEAGITWEKNKEEEYPAFKKKKSNGRPEKGLWNPNAKGWFCAGYGPMRRLSGSSPESMRYTMDNVVGQYTTLFREDASLGESENWLRQCLAKSLEADGNEKNDNETLLENVQKMLNDNLLPLGMKICKISNLGDATVIVKNNLGIELPMRDISDGCRGIYALILDLIQHLYLKYGIDRLFNVSDGHTIIDRPGVVLIDEIEAHLHPQWQLEIVDWLKVHFPKIQFIITTHSSLVAQNADIDGIFVLPLHSESERKPRKLDREESDKIRMGRAGKTLLGTAFGLKVTRSSWALKQIDRWKQLNAKSKKAPMSSEEKKEHELLKKLLETSLDPEDKEGVF